MTRQLIALSGLLLFVCDSAFCAEPAVKAVPAFNADVRPILKAYCTECHGEEAKPKGGLDLRLQRFALQGGRSGPAVVAGKPEESPLIERVVSEEMPPGKKKLNAKEIETLRKWITAGAKVETAEPETLAVGFAITENDRQYWAYQPIKRPAPPASGHPIDAFLLKSLRDKGLSFAPPADRATLIRRLSFDLIGFPPTPEEVQAFVKDASPDATEKLIKRLLASPHYGERWGRHWLDVAGYADSEGGSPADPIRTDAWKYRDYVIRSFNADKPFDRFITEQLAGDELVKPPYPELTTEDLDALIATGFLRNAPDGTGAGGVDQKLARNQVLTDTVKITASAFLGLTVGCAECHNHRYDPIPQTDFYRLRAIFEPALDPTSWKPPVGRQVSLYTAANRKVAAEVEAEAAAIEKVRLKKQTELIEATFERELAKLPAEMREKARTARDTPAAKRTAEQKKLMQVHPSLNVSAGSLYLYDSKAAAVLKKMADEAAEVRKKKPVEQFVRALAEAPTKKPPTTFLFHRGDPDQPKEAVAPGTLAVLERTFPMEAPSAPASGTTGRRLAFANWLTDAKNPLTARVLVNRIWMHHFGRGLVGTPGDFGFLGERPTHPELLDWLAAEFIEKGWSVKHLHQLILTSAAFRQSSLREPAKEKIDPDNRLLGRFPLLRLDAEAIRDSVLAVSGKLNVKAFGPPVPVKENEFGLFVLGIDNTDGAGRFTAEIPLPAGDEFRRSVYVQVRRSRPLGELSTFDWANPEPNCEVRDRSTATPQSLLLLNGEFNVAQGQAFAQRVQKEAGPEEPEQVKLAWQLAYGQTPTDKELSDAREFLANAEDAFRKLPPPSPAKAGVKAVEVPTPRERALATFCQALLSSNRFLYVE